MFDAKRATAFAFARKLTLEPHLIVAADIEALRPHFNDAEILEIVYHVSRYNSTERWTDSTGVPQDQRSSEPNSALDTPTSPEAAARKSELLPDNWVKRPPLEPRSEVEAALSQARTRKSRVALPDVEQVRQLLPPEVAGQPPREWMRAILQFPETGTGYIRTYDAMQRVGRISAKLKAQIAWIAARHDRAWYALADAQQRLAALGVSTDEQYQLDNPAAHHFTPGELAAFAFAQKLTIAPQQITDADVESLKAHYSDHETAEIIFVTCSAATFDRFTEALGLTIEE